MPSERLHASCTRAGAAEDAHAPERFGFDLRNDGDWPVECTVEVLAADATPGDPAPAAGAVRDRWTWSYWLDAVDRRRDPGPEAGADPASVRVVADDGRVAGTWTAPDDVVHVAVTETVLAARTLEA